MKNARPVFLVFLIILLNSNNVFCREEVVDLKGYTENQSAYVGKLVITDTATIEDLTECISVHRKMIPKKYRIIFEDGYYAEDPYAEQTNLIIPGLIQYKATEPKKYFYFCNMKKSEHGNFFIVDRLKTWGGMRLDRMLMRKGSKGIFGNPLVE